MLERITYIYIIKNNYTTDLSFAYKSSKTEETNKQTIMGITHHTIIQRMPHIELYKRSLFCWFKSYIDFNQLHELFTQKG